jgi:hypothetical protein
MAMPQTARSTPGARVAAVMSRESCSTGVRGLVALVAAAGVRLAQPARARIDEARRVER